MWRSLVATSVLAGLLATGTSLLVFRDYTHGRTVGTLRREAAGLAALYGQEAGRQAFSSRHLEQATGKPWRAVVPIDNVGIDRDTLAAPLHDARNEYAKTERCIAEDTDHRAAVVPGQIRHAVRMHME